MCIQKYKLLKKKYDFSITQNPPFKLPVVFIFFFFLRNPLTYVSCFKNHFFPLVCPLRNSTAFRKIVTFLMPCWYYRKKNKVYIYVYVYISIYILQPAGSIPDGVNGIFHWHNSSGRTMALRSTQPLTEMSTRNISWG